MGTENTGFAGICASQARPHSHRTTRVAISAYRPVPLMSPASRSKLTLRLSPGINVGCRASRKFPLPDQPTDWQDWASARAALIAATLSQTGTVIRPGLDPQQQTSWLAGSTCTQTTKARMLSWAAEWLRRWFEKRRELRAQELCESRGGRPGLPSLISLRFLWT